MPWSWGDSIDATTDLFDVDLWNALLAAVHERWLASGAAAPYGELVYDGPTPTLTPGKPDIWTPGDTDKSDPLKGITSTQYGSTGIQTWFHKSVAEMQYLLRNSLYKFINHVKYPNPLNNGYIIYEPNPAVVPRTVPEDFTWNENSIGDSLDYPSGPTESWVRVFRRKQPRRIYSLDATTNQDYASHYYFGGYTYWNYTAWGTLEPGDKAQYYAQPPGYGFGGGWSTVRVPGPYRGVWVYLGDGQWEPAPSGSAADTLDSLNEFFSKDWCIPSPMMPGDYFGPWLLNDIYQICKLLKWTYHEATPYSSDNSQGYYDRKTANALFSESTEDAIKADALARMNGATPEKLFSGFGVGMSTYWTGPDPFDRFGASANTIRLRIGAPFVYQGIPRTTETFAFASPIGTFNTFGALPLANQHWAKINTTARAAGAHEYAPDITPVLVDYPQPTFGANSTHTGWAINPPYSVGLSWINYFMAAINKWTFQYA